MSGLVWEAELPVLRATTGTRPQVQRAPVRSLSPAGLAWAVFPEATARPVKVAEAAGAQRHRPCAQAMPPCRLGPPVEVAAGAGAEARLAAAEALEAQVSRSSA